MTIIDNQHAEDLRRCCDVLQAEIARLERNNDMRHSQCEQEALRSALNCMLTFFGMDECAENREVFDKARAALAAPAAPQAGEDARPAALPDDAYAALSYVEGSLAAIANRQEVRGDVIERIDTIGAAAKRAKAALARLQAVAHHFEDATPLPAAQAAPAVPLLARALAEWHEDDGPVMWWAWCGHEWAGEPPWCGTPLDSDWPGYHTHWTAMSVMPAALTTQGASHGK